ncbi:MAG: hypothetical protein M3Y42_04045 [Actinomycetota bacterium]|nr:hypothetical protein [Actinomycetota bacterium]
MPTVAMAPAATATTGLYNGYGSSFTMAYNMASNAATAAGYLPQQQCSVYYWDHSYEVVLQCTN